MFHLLFHIIFQIAESETYIWILKRMIPLNPEFDRGDAGWSENSKVFMKICGKCWNYKFFPTRFQKFPVFPKFSTFS